MPRGVQADGHKLRHIQSDLSPVGKIKIEIKSNKRFAPKTNRSFIKNQSTSFTALINLTAQLINNKCFISNCTICFFFFNFNPPIASQNAFLFFP